MDISIFKKAKAKKSSSSSAKPEPENPLPLIFSLVISSKRKRELLSKSIRALTNQHLKLAKAPSPAPWSPMSSNCGKESFSLILQESETLADLPKIYTPKLPFKSPSSVQHQSKPLSLLSNRPRLKPAEAWYFEKLRKFCLAFAKEANFTTLFTYLWQKNVPIKTFLKPWSMLQNKTERQQKRPRRMKAKLKKLNDSEK